jgi:hypothetical protein
MPELYADPAAVWRGAQAGEPGREVPQAASEQSRIGGQVRRQLQQHRAEPGGPGGRGSP